MVNIHNKSNAARALIAAAAIALLASGCGTDESETVTPVTTAAPETTVASTTSEAVAPTTTQEVAQPDTAETAVATTTVAPETDTEDTATVTTTAPAEEVTPDTTVPAEEPEPEPVTEPEPEPELAPEPEIPEETTVTTVAPETEPEPEPEPTVTTVAPESEPEPAPEPEQEEEPEPAAEQDEPETEDTPELEQPTGPDLSQYQPGDVVRVADLWPDAGYADNFVCEINEQGTLVDDEGNQNCWFGSDAWVRPQAGVVPETYPVCEAPPYGSDCIPPSSWQGADVPIGLGGIPYELPRRSERVGVFADWCFSVWFEGDCRHLFTLMKWSIDYLGGDPRCVLDEYAARVQAWLDGSTAENLPHQFGWHNCATVIDPLIGTPEGGLGANDIGYRLSDTGISVAEHCRAVLPSDIELEVRAQILEDPPDRYGNDCDAWGAQIEIIADHLNSWLGDCAVPYFLAQEWMEHHYGVPEDYYPVKC